MTPATRTPSAQISVLRAKASAKYQCRYVSVNSGIARGLRAEGTKVSLGRSERTVSPHRDDQVNGSSSRSFPVQRRLTFRRPADFAYEIKTPRITYTTAASQFLSGTRTVTAAIPAGRRKLYKLYTSGQGEDVEGVRTLARTRDVPFESVDERAVSARLVGVPGATRGPHDGILLDCSPLPELPARSLSVFSSTQDTFTVDLHSQDAEQEHVNGTDNVLAGQGQGWRKPVVLWAHGVTDTGNLGALCRSALFFGVSAVAVTVRGSSAVTLATIKAGAGAPEFMPLLRVRDPSSFIRESQAAGWKFFAAVAPSARRRPTDPAEMSVNPAIRDPCVLVLGNEELGLPEDIIHASDTLVSIPARSSNAAAAGVDSLNVSVAGAILIERFSRGLNDAETSRHEKRLF